MQISERGIYNFKASRQSFINENCSNSSHDFDLKFEAVTKLDKRNTARSKKFDAYSETCDVIDILPISLLA